MSKREPADLVMKRDPEAPETSQIVERPQRWRHLVDRTETGIRNSGIRSSERIRCWRRPAGSLVQAIVELGAEAEWIGCRQSC